MPSLTTADPLLGPHSHPQLVTALKSARETFTAANPESRLAYSEATRYFPGGNTRTLLHSLPFPLTFQSAHSCYLTSVDNATYIDFCSEYTSGLFGHSHPVIKNAIEAVLTTGWNYGGLNDRERHFAKLVCERFHLDKVRFTNSGTEASMMAIAAAMNFTNRDRILVFTNGFHGSTINFPTPAPAKSIVLPLKFVVAPFNDIEGTKGIISRQPEHSLAAIFVEPVQGAGGAIPASVEFLRFLREAATASSAVYIIDETMTSRLAYHGWSYKMGIEADLMTLGKWIGGGMTFGAFGGREDIMSQFGQNTGSLAHSGTFNNNVFSMTAGLAGLQLIDESAIERVNTLGDEMRLQLQEILRRHAVPRMYVRGLGSMLAVHFSGQYALIFKGLFFHHLLTHGIYIASRGFISLSIEITQDHVQRFAEAFERFVALYAAFLLVEEQAGKVNSQL
ncbi:hypothetical protein TMatcc_006910 [Talaromyces marneffei ATCC 18224]